MGNLDYTDFAYLEKEHARPHSVNPSLHNAVQEAHADRGLFKLADGIYQVRGDLAFITWVRGERGWVVLDTGFTREFAAHAWALLQQHLPAEQRAPISAVIYSHSHIDHFGGVKGLINQAPGRCG